MKENTVIFNKKHYTRRNAAINTHEKFFNLKLDDGNVEIDISKNWELKEMIECKKILEERLEEIIYNNLSKRDKGLASKMQSKIQKNEMRLLHDLSLKEFELYKELNNLDISNVSKSNRTG